MRKEDSIFVSVRHYCLEYSFMVPLLFKTIQLSILVLVARKCGLLFWNASKNLINLLLNCVVVADIHASVCYEGLYSANCELSVASWFLLIFCELRVASCEFRVASCELQVASWFSITLIHSILSF